MTNVHIVTANNKNIAAFSTPEDANEFAGYFETESGQEAFVDDIVFNPDEWEQFIED